MSHSNYDLCKSGHNSNMFELWHFFRKILVIIIIILRAIYQFKSEFFFQKNRFFWHFFILPKVVHILSKTCVFCKITSTEPIFDVQFFKNPIPYPITFYKIFTFCLWFCVCSSRKHFFKVPKNFEWIMIFHSNYDFFGIFVAFFQKF